MSSSSQNNESWISMFCSIVGHEYFAEINEDFIEDDFNLTGLQSQVPLYKEALEMILDVEPETDYSDEVDEDDDASDDDFSDGGTRRPKPGYYSEDRRRARLDYAAVESSAEMLYGLIHQRFITSRQGIQQMLEKYEIGHFGTCPRVHCRGAKVLPVGTSDIPGHDTVKLFCPSCLDVYAPPNSRFQVVDGAFFGTTFGCLFFMTFPELDVGAGTGAPMGKAGNGNASAPPVPEGALNGVAVHNLGPGLGAGRLFEPRIYGFRVSEFARSGPRMKWLRMKPSRIEDLDEVTLWEDTRAAMRSDEVEAADEDMDALDEEEEETASKKGRQRPEDEGAAVGS